MSKDEIYRRRCCELCGREAFEKLINQSELDGGYTTVNHYELSGFGSAVFCWYDVDIGRKEYRLCPSCAERINNAITDTVEQIMKENNQNEINR